MTSGDNTADGEDMGLIISGIPKVTIFCSFPLGGWTEEEEVPWVTVVSSLTAAC